MTNLFSLSTEESTRCRTLEACSDKTDVYFRDRNEPLACFKANFTSAPILAYEPVGSWPNTLQSFTTCSLSFTTFRTLIESRASFVCKFWSKGAACDLPSEMQKLLQSLTSSEKRQAEIERFRKLNASIH